MDNFHTYLKSVGYQLWFLLTNRYYSFCQKEFVVYNQKYFPRD